MTQLADVFSGGSYALTSDMQPHFDLGIATSVEKLKVRPSGNIELFPVSGCRPVFDADRGPEPAIFGCGGKRRNTFAQVPISLVTAVF
jgi:hypothetical protein